MDKKQKIMNLLLIVLLLFFSSLEALVFLYYINNFVNGFTPTDLLGTTIGDTVYGFKAVAVSAIALIILRPVC